MTQKTSQTTPYLKMYLIKIQNLFSVCIFFLNDLPTPGNDGVTPMGHHGFYYEKGCFTECQAIYH